VAKVYYDKDADLSLLQDKTIAIIGFGSQGHAHALNLHDSGCQVVVGLYAGSKSWQKAQSHGLKVMTVAEAAAAGDIIMILVPDNAQPKVYREEIAPHLKSGKTLMFAHGFNIRYGQIVPPAEVDVSMIAPKSPGHRVRELYVDGAGTPGILAVEQNPSGKAKEQALAYGRAVGCTRAGVIETTFTEETETDLFGEQAVLCGGVSHLIEAGFDTLVEAGYQPEIAYFECLNELKLIVDLIYQGGMSYMRYSVSDTAEHGDYYAGPKIIDDHVKQAMRKLLADIQSGAYAEAWIAENENGRPWFNAQRQAHMGTKIEVVGRDLRKMMPWLHAKEVNPGEGGA
jgi:ketol-acid reductoisomerase